MRCPRCNLDLINSNQVLISQAKVRRELEYLRKDNEDLKAQLAKRNVDTANWKKEKLK